MASLSSQPAEKGAHQQLCVETIGLRTTVLTRHSDTRGMNDKSLGVPCPKPACQPKPITSCFIGNDDALDLPPRSDCFATPAMQQFQQPRLIRCQLFQRLPGDAGNHSSDQPTRLAHLDYYDERAILVQGGEGPA
jgi:hypothetical protein